MAIDEKLASLQPSDTEQSRRRTRGRPRRRATVVVAVLLGLALVAAGAVRLAVGTVDARIERIPLVFESIPETERPAIPAATEPGAEGLTFLLAGLDRRSDAPSTGSDARVPTWVPGAARTDALLVVRVTGDRESATVVSIPRDSWVDVPGHGQHKINAAYSLGGPSLLVRTVEALTDLRVDHLAVIDMRGFSSLVDAVGGVEITLDQPAPTRGETIPAGTHVLSGEQALDYVGERRALPGGDFDRVRRQQEVLRAVLSGLRAADTLTSPARLRDVVSAVTRTTSVDDELTGTAMLRLAVQMRNIGKEDVTFLTVPTLGVGTAGKASIVRYDYARAAELWRAVREETLSPGR